MGRASREYSILLQEQKYRVMLVCKCNRIITSNKTGKVKGKSVAQKIPLRYQGKNEDVLVSIPADKEEPPYLAI